MMDDENLGNPENLESLESLESNVLEMFVVQSILSVLSVLSEFQYNHLSNHENYIDASMDYGLTMAMSGKLERSKVSSFTRYLLPIMFGMLVLSMTDQLSSKEAWEIRVAIPPTVLLTLIFISKFIFL